MSASHVDTRLGRIETKLDDLNKAIVLLARIEERLVVQSQMSQRLGERMETIESRVSNLELSRAKFMGAVMVVSGLGSCAWPFVEKLFGV